MVTSLSTRWFDFVVVGSGTAGAVLAARLSEDPTITVAVVESGGPAVHPGIADPLQWPSLQGSAVDWRYVTIPQPHTANRIHDWPRGRVVGGTSAINAMAHVRGHPSDFDGWAARGCTGWGFADLLPYFIRSEASPYGRTDWHGDSGPLILTRPTDAHPITRAYMQAGIDHGFAPIDEHNGPRMAGPTLNTLNIVDGRRQTIADAYLTPALGRPNLQLATGIDVQAVAVEGGKATGVIARAGRDEVRINATRAVILAAGTIGSACLLMRSGIGRATELAALGITPAHDLPGVGRNLQDHLLSGGNVYRARRPVPPSRYQHSESLMYVDPSNSGAAPDLVLACVVAPVVTEQFVAPPAGSAYTLMFGFTHPRSRGSVRLASADPAVPPIIDPNYLGEERDRAAYLDALDLAQAIGHGRALDDWRAEELLPAKPCRDRASRLAFLGKAAHTHHHPVGTCKMGIDDEAVVGPDLRVRGIEGLVVVDASVFPVITTGPTNAAVVALAERAADLFLDRPILPPAAP